MCTVRLLSAKSEQQENLAESSALTGKSFVLNGGDERCGGSYLPSSAVEPFSCEDSNQGRSSKHGEGLHWSGEEELSWLGTALKVGGFDFNGNFSTLEKREMLQTSSLPASPVGTFCVLKLQFFRHLQLLLSVVGL